MLQAEVKSLCGHRGRGQLGAARPAPSTLLPEDHACHFLSLPVLPREAGHAGASPDSVSS